MAHLTQQLLEWEQLRGDPHLEDGALRLVQFLENKLYNDYEPCPFSSFATRFHKWLENVTEDTDKKTLISLLANTLFIGRREFDALYRDLYRNHLSRWIVERYSIDFSDDNFDESVKQLLAYSWICPLTDSLRINGFLKVNNLRGQEHRPDWYSLSQFGDKALIQKYITHHGIADIVLIEDFVGSGSQSAETIEFASQTAPNCQIVVSPLIICPKGHELFAEVAARLRNVVYLPCLVLPDSSFMSKTPATGEPACFTAARELFTRIHHQMGYASPDDLYGFLDTGGLVISYSNCPDNTLPIFHSEGSSWKALFPRVWRGG